MSYLRSVRFLLSFTALSAMVAGAVGFILGIAFGTDGARAAALSASIGAIAAAGYAVRILRAELRELSRALSQSLVFITLAQCKAVPPGTDLLASIDLNAIQRDAIRLAKTKLAGRRFRAIDIDAELSCSERRADPSLGPVRLDFSQRQNTVSGQP